MDNFLRSTFLLVFSMLVFSCGNSEKGEKEEIKLGDYNESPAQVEEEEDGKRVQSSRDNQLSKGVGPVSSVNVNETIDEELSNRGAAIFNNLCVACHRMDTRLVGPALAGVTERRSPEWIMNMILNPQEMVKKDPTAQKLLAEYNGAMMIDQNLSQDDARAVLEYFRQYDEK